MARTRNTVARSRKTAAHSRKAAAHKRKAAAGLDLRKEVRDMGKRLDYLMAQARKAEAGARATAMRQLRQLQRNQSAANRALAKLGRQSAAASTPIIAGLQKAWRDIELSVRQAAKRFRETG
jgi:predicted  nucleic acid-binding Zn-ribbon protein